MVESWGDKCWRYNEGLLYIERMPLVIRKLSYDTQISFSFHPQNSELKGRGCKCVSMPYELRSTQKEKRSGPQMLNYFLLMIFSWRGFCKLKQTSLIGGFNLCITGNVKINIYFVVSEVSQSPVAWLKLSKDHDKCLHFWRRS